MAPGAGRVGGVWSLTCRGCGVDFEAPVTRGRPRGYCDACNLNRPPSWHPRALREAAERQWEEDRRRMNLGPRRALDPGEILELQRRADEGWTNEQLARTYGVVPRTVTRVKRLMVVRRTIGPWSAWFALERRGKRFDPGKPKQLTEWSKDRDDRFRAESAEISSQPLDNRRMRRTLTT